MAPWWDELRERDGILPKLLSQPQLAFEGGVLEWIQELAPEDGREACVMGSGDNYAAFALAALGWNVTSVDISEQQLAIAQRRAARLDLDIRFVRADVTDMPTISDDAFDLVCSTNGLFVWISDLAALFRETARILRPDGLYAGYDVHPFQRPWKDQPGELAMGKPYFDTGPYRDVAEDGTTSFEFHWKFSDLLNAITGAGLTLLRLGESPAVDSRFWHGASYEPAADERPDDWKENPRSGLPVWLTMAARKSGQ